MKVLGIPCFTFSLLSARAGVNTSSGYPGKLDSKSLLLEHQQGKIRPWQTTGLPKPCLEKPGEVASTDYGVKFVI